MVATYSQFSGLVPTQEEPMLGKQHFILWMAWFLNVQFKKERTRFFTLEKKKNMSGRDG